MTPTQFDIYVRGDGRWSRQESFPGKDKNAAVAHAAELDASGTTDGVRVIAVTEYGSGRSPLETLIWISPHLSKVAAVSQQMRAAAQTARAQTSPKNETEPEPTPTPEKEIAPSPALSSEEKKAPVTPTTPAGPPLGIDKALAGKIGLNTFSAAALAAISFMPITYLLRSINGSAGFSTEIQHRITLAVSLIIFVITALMLITRVVHTSPPVRASSSKPAFRRRPRKTVATGPETRPSQSVSEADMPETETSETETSETDTPAAEPVDVTATGLNEAMRHDVLKFLASALDAIKDEVPRVNQHVSFGLNLFGAGAARAYGEATGLSKMQSFVLVRETIEALGNKADRVDAFCRQYPDYASEERYQMMIAAGEEAMRRHVAGDPEPFANFTEVIQTWTSDTAVRAQAQGIVCIMFTDLVGSTQMTHERGDYAAQEVVRVHNAVVRQSLAAHHGHEVKHTGDGIMASFSSAANAVRAGADIQRELTTLNAKPDVFPVLVRIGLNAGDAVQEEDDFFGTTVQLAARVCDKAGTGEVFLTDNVRVLSDGQGLTFNDAGKFEMKGVPEPMALYQVGISSVPADS